MTDEPHPRPVRQLLGELRATEAYLRVQAARVLPYEGMLRMERLAHERCHALLDALGVSPGAAPFDSYGPIPHLPTSLPQDRQVTPSPERVTPRYTARQTPQDVPPPAPPSGGTPAPASDFLDDQLTAAGPSGPRRRPQTQSSSLVTETPPAPPSADSPPLTSARATGPRPAPRQQSPSQSLVSFGNEPSRPTGTISYGDDGLVMEEDEFAATPTPTVAPKAAPAPPPKPAVSEPEPTTSVLPAPRRTPAPATAGLYGGAVPVVRGTDAARPRAAAIQLNASGTGGRVVTDEEDEPIAVGAAEDFEDDGADGFALALHEDEYDYAEEEPGQGLDLESEPVEPEIEAPPPPSPEEVASLLAQAQSVAATGNLHGAAELYSDVIDCDPENAMAHIERGRLYLDLGDYSRAMSDFMVAEDLAPDNPESMVAVGDLFFARKEYRRAVDYFTAALTVDPDHAMAHCRRGICHYYRKNYRDCPRGPTQGREAATRHPEHRDLRDHGTEEVRPRCVANFAPRSDGGGGG